MHQHFRSRIPHGEPREGPHTAVCAPGRQGLKNPCDYMEAAHTLTHKRKTRTPSRRHAANNLGKCSSFSRSRRQPRQTGKEDAQGERSLSTLFRSSASLRRPRQARIAQLDAGSEWIGVKTFLGRRFLFAARDRSFQPCPRQTVAISATLCLDHAAPLETVVAPCVRGGGKKKSLSTFSRRGVD